MALQNPKIDTMGGFMNAIYYIPSYQRAIHGNKMNFRIFGKI